MRETINVTPAQTELFALTKIIHNLTTSRKAEVRGLEMCMGMGFPVGMGIAWNFHGNGNEKQISTGMGMISLEVGMLENAL